MSLSGVTSFSLVPVSGLHRPTLYPFLSTFPCSSTKGQASTHDLFLWIYPSTDQYFSKKVTLFGPGAVVEDEIYLCLCLGLWPILGLWDVQSNNYGHDIHPRLLASHLRQSAERGREPHFEVRDRRVGGKDMMRGQWTSVMSEKFKHTRHRLLFRGKELVCVMNPGRGIIQGNISRRQSNQLNQVAVLLLRFRYIQNPTIKPTSNSLKPFLLYLCQEDIMLISQFLMIIPYLPYKTMFPSAVWTLLVIFL